MAAWTVRACCEHGVDLIDQQSAVTVLFFSQVVSNAPVSGLVKDVESVPGLVFEGGHEPAWDRVRSADRSKFAWTTLVELLNVVEDEDGRCGVSPGWRRGSCRVAGGFDFAVGQGFVRLLGEAHPSRDFDPVADMVSRTSHRGQIPIGKVLAAAWRAALIAIAERATPRHARAALELISVDEEAASRHAPRPRQRSTTS
ncbi:MAG: hypothetical protein ABWY57_05650 [Mycetocola sp.]